METIRVHQGDDPRALATDFCHAHALADAVIDPLTAHIQQNIAALPKRATAPAGESAAGGSGTGTGARPDGGKTAVAPAGANSETSSTGGAAVAGTGASSSDAALLAQVNQQEVALGPSPRPNSSGVPRPCGLSS